jgi:uncharacterized protein (TIGR03437 family)
VGVGIQQGSSLLFHNLCNQLKPRREVCAAIALIMLGTLPMLRAANIGAVVPVVGQVVDLVYDASRRQVYLANSTNNQIDIYSVDIQALVGSIPVGTQPTSLALAAGGNILYVANAGSQSMTIIDISARQAIREVAVGARPDAIAVGSDGNVMILGTAGLMRFEVASGQIVRLPISPPPTQPAGINPINPAPALANFFAGLIATPSGNLMIGLSTNRLFVYEVASGAVLRSRNVTGLRPILSVSPDGTRFMAGPFLFDMETLAILGRSGSPAANLTGGSAFSPDGNTVYGTFSTQPAINALNTNNPQNAGGAVIPGGGRPAVVTLGVLQVMRASSLTPIMGLRVAETINPKIVASPDGRFLFAISTSGLTVIPIGTLGNQPILQVDSSNVVLSVDICNRGVATADIRISNSGAGRMTYSAALNNANAPVILNIRSGVAPSTLQVSFNPRAVLTRGTQQFSVILVSPEAVNIEPAILINLNFRDVDQRGSIVPLNGFGVDLLTDELRQRVYIANYMLDEIDVYSITERRFLPPVRVGNRPLSMSMANPFTLVVANSGSEAISVVDLETLQETRQIQMAPVPLNANPLFPRSIASSSNAVLFTVIPLPATAGTAPGAGSVWQLSLGTGTSFPRLNLGGAVVNAINGRNVLVAPGSGSAIVLVEGNGTLRLYDPLSDNFAITRTAAFTGFRGSVSATPDGSYFIVDDTVFNSVLAVRGSIAPQAGVIVGGNAQQLLSFGATAFGSSAIRVTAANATVPVQSLQRFNLSSLQADQQLRLPESVSDISPAVAGAAAATRLWPPLPTALEIGVRGQTWLLPHGLVVDSSSTSYALSFSGLTIVPMQDNRNRAPSFSVGGVVNAASFTGAPAPGGLVSIFGSDLASADAAGSLPLPTFLGDVCVTANDIALPLLATSPSQINAQIPPELAAGRVTLAVRSPSRGTLSAGVLVTVNATAPGIFTIDQNGRRTAALFHADSFRLVSRSDPATRDEDLVLYATGLGAVTPSVAGGEAARSSPLSLVTAPVRVTIGGHEQIVTFSGLAPDFVGLYQINIRVPGSRVRGDDLPVVLTVGSVASTTAAAPLTSID